jgi:peptidoglycan-associated lipoprotein
MKTKFVGIFVIVTLIGFALSGCGCFMQAQKGETPPPAPPPAVVQAPEEKPVVVVAPPPPPPPVAPPPAPLVMLKDINFDFDKYNIRPGDAEILRQNMAWFKANPGKSMKVEGNCDERGTVEYNLALGQRRADSTKDFLVNLGVNGTLLSTVSYGKEKPICQERNEGCWAQNRRAHFVPVP